MALEKIGPKKNNFLKKIAGAAFSAAIEIGNIDPEKDRESGYRPVTEFPHLKPTELEIKHEAGHNDSEVAAKSSEPHHPHEYGGMGRRF